jgi:hypothetical protein
MNIRLAERDDTQALVGFNQAMASEPKGKSLRLRFSHPVSRQSSKTITKAFTFVAETMDRSSEASS